jgi:hypothetical protein
MENSDEGFMEMTVLQKVGENRYKTHKFTQRDPMDAIIKILKESTHVNTISEDVRQDVFKFAKAHFPTHCDSKIGHCKGFQQIIVHYKFENNNMYFYVTKQLRECENDGKVEIVTHDYDIIECKYLKILISLLYGKELRCAKCRDFIIDKQSRLDIGKIFGERFLITNEKMKSVMDFLHSLPIIDEFSEID